MKPSLLALAVFAASWPAVAQNVRVEPEEDPVQAAIREFNLRDRSKPNEVTVVLDSPDAAPPKAAVLVTGTPPENAEMIGKDREAEAAAEEKTGPAAAIPSDPAEEDAEVPAESAESAVASAPPEPKGLTVRVEKLQAGNSAIDASKVKLAAPFPAKPISRPPEGWKVLDSEQAPELTREVELAPGSTITLTVRPHVLVPEDDGETVFSVSEPGFDTALGYAQNATVGAILSGSLLRMDEDSKRLGEVVDQLQQLLVSLPKPAPPETTANTNQR